MGRLTVIAKITRTGDYNEKDVKDTLHYADGDPDAVVVALGAGVFLPVNPVGHRDRVLQTRHGDDKGKWSFAHFTSLTTPMHHP